MKTVHGQGGLGLFLRSGESRRLLRHVSPGDGGSGFSPFQLPPDKKTCRSAFGLSGASVTLIEFATSENLYRLLCHTIRIKRIVSLKNSRIQITAISLSRNTDLTKTVIVRGTSQTRDALTSFNNDLRADSVFTKVDLPLTNLIKDVNTDFTITLTYKDILN